MGYNFQFSYFFLFQKRSQNHLLSKKLFFFLQNRYPKFEPFWFEGPVLKPINFKLNRFKICVYRLIYLLAGAASASSAASSSAAAGNGAAAAASSASAVATAA